MTTRDEALALALNATAESLGYSPPGESYVKAMHAAMDALAAAGLLRPDPTGEDAVVLAEAIAEGEATAGEDWISSIVNRILAAGFTRPRGPVTETPAVTPVGFDYAWIQDGSAVALYAMPGVPFRTAEEAAELGRTLGSPGKVIRRPRGRWEPAPDLRGSDGLTDGERHALAQRHAETVAQDRTPEEVTSLRERAKARGWTPNKDAQEQIDVLTGKRSEEDR